MLSKIKSLMVIVAVTGSMFAITGTSNACSVGGEIVQIARISGPKVITSRVYILRTGENKVFNFDVRDGDFENMLITAYTNDKDILVSSDFGTCPTNGGYAGVLTGVFNRQ